MTSSSPSPLPPPPLAPGKRLRYLLEYLGIRAMRGLIRRMPPRFGIALADGLGRLGFACLRRRRAIAIANIIAAGLAADRTAATRIARASFRHFAILSVETILAERVITPENWTQHVDVSGAQDMLERVQRPGEGLILATAHFGNWEVAAQVMTLFKPMAALARRMNNPYTDRLVQTRKRGYEFRTILKHEARAALLLEVLRGGHLLAMLMDQHARYRGMLIPFMGRPAATNTAAAVLHLRSGAPLCFAYCLRTGPLRYRLICPKVFVRDPQAPAGEAGILGVMEAITRQLETAIREHPEQYLWAHRRWRVEDSHRLRVPPQYAALAGNLSASPPRPSRSLRADR